MTFQSTTITFPLQRYSIWNVINFYQQLVSKHYIIISKIKKLPSKTKNKSSFTFTDRDGFNNHENIPLDRRNKVYEKFQNNDKSFIY